MNPRGYVLVIAGAWVLCQVFGGNALQRLKIIPEEAAEGPRTLAPGAPTVPPGGLGNI